MDRIKRERLVSHGWQIGDVKEFLDLSDEEVEYIEIKLALSRKVRLLRQEKGLTQEQAADLVGSSQSRVAKMEAGEPNVSIDLLVKTLIALGASRAEVAKVIGSDAFAAA